MNEKKKAELKAETWEISEILFLAQESLKIIHYLLKAEEDDDVSYIKRATAFFKYDVSIHWRVVVIELSKLFSGKANDQYNLNKFLNKLKKHGHYGDANVSEEKVADWEAELDREIDVINNLLQQRDGLYAHTDKRSRGFANTVSTQKCRELVVLVQKIVREIYLSVFGSGLGG